LSIETSNTSAILNANSREGVSQSPFFHPNLYTIFIRIHFSLIQILFAMSYNREQQGGKNMMDLIALGILIICFGCVKLFANFCESLINPKEK